MLKRRILSLSFVIAVLIIGLVGLLNLKVKGQTAPDEVDGDEEIEACGVERWSIKVLTDADTNKINFTPVATTIQQLVALKTPTPNANMTRQPVERQVYVVKCIVTKVKLEDDGDYHLVLADSAGRTMIGEIPDPTCPSTTPSAHLAQFKACRSFMDKNYNIGTSFQTVNARCIVTGMPFVDPPHGQTGAAPNNLELHSILNIKFDNDSPIVTAIRQIAYDTRQGNALSIFPNPLITDATIQLKGDALPGPVMLNIYDLSGKLIRALQLPTDNSSITLDRANLTKGVYVCRAVCEGRPLAVLKMMVE